MTFSRRGGSAVGGWARPRGHGAGHGPAVNAPDETAPLEDSGPVVGRKQEPMAEYGLDCGDFLCHRGGEVVGGRRLKARERVTLDTGGGCPSRVALQRPLQVVEEISDQGGRPLQVATST